MGRLSNRDEGYWAPPRWAEWLLFRFCPPGLEDELQGDLLEMYDYWVKTLGVTRARWRYALAVLRVIRPFSWSTIRHPHPSTQLQRPGRAPRPPDYPSTFILHPDMLRNYFKIAWRNLVQHKTYSAINIGGLAVGMAVAVMIGLWMEDEFSFNKYHHNYNRIAKLMQGAWGKEGFGAGEHMPLPLAHTLRTEFAGDFTHVVLSSWNGEHILAYGDKKLTRTGSYMSPQAPDMLTLKMLKGTRAGLQDPSSILLSESVAQALFGDTDPLGKIVRIDNKLTVTVTGVFEDLPYNSEFREMQFMAPWELYVSSQPWIRDNAGWNDNSFQILAQIAPNAEFETVSRKIKDLRLIHVPQTAHLNPVIFLQPMSRWHLYGWNKSGQPEGRIQYVWLFGIIGVFVLLLACINFMNLSTARSEKRAKEVGIRKTMGSLRRQLIGQFMSESLLVVALAFVGCLLVVSVLLPFFNQIADKQISIPWRTPWFWGSGIGFSLFTGLVAGSYPAFYLSSFQPVKVLKGTFRVGRLARIPRKVLVVVQFTVSISLVLGTILVFRQIEHAKRRPLGYDRNGLITLPMSTPELQGHYNTLRSQLLASGAVVEMATSSSPTTRLTSRQVGFEWEGKDPDFKAQLGTMAVTHDFGTTVGWQFVAGRDFSRQFATDSAGMILNETALRYMGLTDPVGKTVKWNGKPYQIVGVIKDMVMDSPFEPVYQTAFLLNYNWASVITIKLNPSLPAGQSLAKVETVFKKFNPGSPFAYKFTDQQYALKFAAEQRLGTLATVFGLLAGFISCLGLFGLATFMAEQRTKELAMRKVLGASTINLWGLLAKDFLVLVLLAFGIAAPIAWYLLQQWLYQYEYRTELSWWVFAAVGAGAVLITLLTVSFQSIKAALINPVKSLRSE